MDVCTWLDLDSCLKTGITATMPQCVECTVWKTVPRAAVRDEQGVDLSGCRTESLDEALTPHNYSSYSAYTYDYISFYLLSFPTSQLYSLTSVFLAPFFSTLFFLPCHLHMITLNPRLRKKDHTQSERDCGLHQLRLPHRL